MTDTGCNCHECKGKCLKPSDAQIEKAIEHMMVVSDVVTAIYEVTPFRWTFLGNYLAMRGVFE